MSGLKGRSWAAVAGGGKEAIEEPLETTDLMTSGYWDSVRSIYNPQQPLVILKSKGLKLLGDYVQRWLTVFGPNIKTMHTVTELKDFFIRCFMPWLMGHYPSSKVFRLWEEGEYGQESGDTYAHLQEWVAAAEKNNAKPWIKCPCWIAAKHINWTTALYILMPTSNLFMNGLLQVEKDTQNITWNVELDPFVSRKLAIL